MPNHFRNSDDFLKKILDQIAPVEPIIPVEMKAAAAIAFMDWKERLRTTEELLQKLSDGYPFT
jgi:phage baseplate assembly protein W